MVWLIFVLLIAANLILFFQDVRSFAIHWVILIITCCLAILWGMLNNEVADFVILSLVNILVFFVIFSLTWILMRLWKKDIDFSNQIGLGDILYVFLVLCFLFHPFFLILFFIFSSLVSLFAYSFFRKKWDRIPFAGLLALQLVVWLLVSRFLSLSLYHYKYGT